MSDRGQRSAASAISLAMTATVIGVLPLFLTGALAVEMRAELGFSATALGGAVAMYRANAALTSSFLGRFTDRFGATVALKVGMVIASVSSVLVALFASNWWWLAAFLFLGGAAQAICPPAANRLLINRVPRERQGIAFGVKQSAPPTASMLAGISVPVIGLTVGWRWAFALVPLCGALVFFAAGRGGSKRRVVPRDAGSARTPMGRGMLALLLVSFGLGTAASGAVPAFFVHAAVTAGVPNELAGGLLAVGSAAAITARLVAGLACDRMAGGQMTLAGALLGGGSVGLFMLSTGRPGWMYVGVMIALAGTWGFNGVFWYALMQAYPAAPGATTGAIAPGGLVGGIIGPVIFGALVDVVSYTVAWMFAAILSVAAFAAMAYSSTKLPR